MNLYFNIRPDIRDFIFIVYIYYIIFFFLLIITIFFLILFILNFKNYLVKQIIIKNFKKKLDSIIQKQICDIIKSNNENIVDNFLDFVQTFRLKYKYEGLQALFEKLNMDNKFVEKIKNYLFKEEHLDEETINYIKNFFKNKENINVDCR